MAADEPEIGLDHDAADGGHHTEQAGQSVVDAAGICGPPLRAVRREAELDDVADHQSAPVASSSSTFCGAAFSSPDSMRRANSTVRSLAGAAWP